MVLAALISGNDKVNKEIFWEMEEARQGAGRRMFKEKEVKRTVAVQRKDIRKKSFGVQDPRFLEHSKGQGETGEKR